MKYDVMVKINEKYYQLIRDSGYVYGTTSYDALEEDDFNPKEWADITIKEIEEYGERFDSFYNTWSYKIRPVKILLHSNVRFKEWVYLKTIDVEDGELRLGDYYEIDNTKCKFEIVYNDNTDKMELRVDYVKDILDCELNENIKTKHEEYQSILNKHTEEKTIEKKIKQQILNEIKKEENKETLCEPVERDKLSFIKRIFKRS